MGDTMPDDKTKDRERRLHHFALAVAEGKAAGPLLDPDAATSALADHLRQHGIEEDRLAKELDRGLTETKAGPHHMAYLKLARSWLGYKDTEGMDKAAASAAGAAAGTTLAAAAATALAQARDKGLLRDQEQEPKPLRSPLLDAIDAKRAA